ncbi:unnamed protein product, partial [Phaeothamnion confervicola]
FACDDPQTSRFYDALAAGCMPIVINDHFRTPKQAVRGAVRAVAELRCNDHHRLGDGL